MNVYIICICIINLCNTILTYAIQLNLMSELRKPHSFRNPEICSKNFNLYKVMGNTYGHPCQFYPTNSQARITDYVEDTIQL